MNVDLLQMGFAFEDFTFGSLQCMLGDYPMLQLLFILAKRE